MEAEVQRILPAPFGARAKALHSEGFLVLNLQLRETVMKWLFDSLPFIEPYPTWVKALLSLWLVFSAVCIAALLLTQPAKKSAAEAATWLRITGVQFKPPAPGLGVRVYAKVNGTTYTYPNVGGVQWVETGPNMAAGSFKLAGSSLYELTFTMETNGGPQYASQETVRLKHSELPAPRSYKLFSVRSGQRAPDPTAEVYFNLSPD